MPNVQKVQGLIAAEVATTASHIIAEVEKAIVGKEEVVAKAVLTLLCNGHLLIEDVPGVGKTTLARALAKCIGGDFRRVQFTPDLLPADITGSSIFNQKTSEFEFRHGPVFGNIVLVDEINRATPKTQSSLLEAMEERQVTADGVTYQLPRPFFVVATQNNVEMTGTYPLPEAQLDRFFARIRIGYPDRNQEVQILTDQQETHPIDSLQMIITPAELIELQSLVKSVHVHDNIKEYCVDLVRATRESSHFQLGSSPRGALYLMRAAQAHAAMGGNNFVRPDDVKATASMVLAHRVISPANVKGRGTQAEDSIAEILGHLTSP